MVRLAEDLCRTSKLYSDNFNAVTAMNLLDLGSTYQFNRDADNRGNFFGLPASMKRFKSSQA